MNREFEIWEVPTINPTYLEVGERKGREESVDLGSHAQRPRTGARVLLYLKSQRKSSFVFFQLKVKSWLDRIERSDESGAVRHFS